MKQIKKAVVFLSVMTVISGAAALAITPAAAAAPGASVVATQAAEYLTVNTPNHVIHGEPVTLSWSGGQGPYTLRVVPGGNPSGPALKEFPKVEGSSLEWTVDLPANESYTLVVADASGSAAFSDRFTVSPGA
ncbi:Ser-Thr-rich GPI-anchored membrane family protein [Streptomyces sp. NPDC052192]|uniref:Ser-Thr-rich GPI-anchored membrane family protein n=1 Tax=Streptomyces sp. NPDC052192 TaxID=3155052 RepID=UPI0034374897